MATVRVWSGYVSTIDACVRWVEFDGKFLGGMTYTTNGRACERAFYEADNGMVVVHDVQRGTWSDGGYTYDQSIIYLYTNVEDACVNFNVELNNLDATSRSFGEPHHIDSETARIYSYTLEEYITEFEICTTHPFA